MFILDVGCGWKPKGNVNIDAYPKWLEQRSKVSKTTEGSLNLKKIPNFIRASAEYLPFRNRVFDKVTSFHVIEHVKNPYRMIKEMLRVSNNQVVIRCPHFLGDTKKNKLHLHHFNLKAFERVINRLNIKYELIYSNWRLFPHYLFPLFRLPVEIEVKIWIN